MKSTNPTTRRDFIRHTAGALALPTIIPASALGKDGRPAPSERITMGCIGYGTIAHSTVRNFLNDERVQIVAIADPNKESGSYGYSGEKRGGREEGKKTVEGYYAKEKNAEYKGCTAYEDLRPMLDREDIDAVNVSTPDHWHALCAIYAARKGKHIYGQKPLALTIQEGRAMQREVDQAGVTWQTGSQQRSEVYFRLAAEFIRNNRLGKLQGVKVGLPGGHSDWNQMGARKEPEAIPEGLNYDLWEGPAPHRAYRPALLPLNWRHNFDYSGGMITDWGAHHLDIVQWALDMDASGPVKLENIKGDLPANDAIWNTPGSYAFDCVYANGIRVQVANNDVHKQGITFEGENDRSIYVKRGKLEFKPIELRKEKIQDDEIKLYESRNHARNFIDCIYSGEPTVAPIEAAHRTISIAHLANIAIRLGRESLNWDPAKELAIDDEEVNGMLGRPMRKPWSLS